MPGHARWTRGVVWLLLAVVPAASAQRPLAEGPDTAARALRIFLTCDANPACDFDYLRTEIIWVDYLRDPAGAQVQVISTALPTGSGGTQVTLRFVGLREFSGLDDEVRYATAQGATTEEQRREFARVLGVGLGRYLLRARTAGDFTLKYEPRGPVGTRRASGDPWDSWVFNVSVNGWVSGQSQSTSRELSASFTTSKTTPAWRFRIGATGSNNRNSYRLSDSSEYLSNTHSYSARGLLAVSMGDHFSAGVTSNVLSSTHQNIDVRVATEAVIEFDLFPYDQYSRRHLVLSYGIGWKHFAYADTTIYDKIRERLLNQTYSMWFAAAEPWGNPYLGIEGSNFLADFQKHRLSIYGGLSVRVVRGLQLSLNGSYSRVRDQINLAKSSATDEEILLQLRELKTNYTYSGYVSLGYTFGSLFNNVVNPRLGGGGDTKP